MKKQVLFIHCGGTQGPNTGSRDLVAYLQDALGSGYDVRYPQMPDPDHPHYATWKNVVACELRSLQDDALLVGHSLGGSVLLKFLSEENITKPIAGLFIIAAPFFGQDEWDVEEYELQHNFFLHLQHAAPVFLYHSNDDEVVPVKHLTFYADLLPHASVHELSYGGHLFGNGLQELVFDIKQLNALAPYESL
ncbi:alpha/beta fold hydrolase [Chryseolinea lacunae]|uniref:Alpha/beta hydrolase n=1 Tax=Chryseolinea lacunae TaxID=2801331 RepID=A0ABS1KNB4_9BACT|nr:alpha/beta fold hydrolase [Chryseolinea lacunae]MBL0740926.1 alpha/beta hydrolase [Chryseolinea lacunae]